MKKKLIILFLLIIIIVKVEASELDITNLKVQKSNNNSLTLVWDNNENVNGYKILRSTSKKGKFSKIVDITENSYINNNLTYGKTYYYKVISYDEEKSTTSNIVSKKVVPNKVENLKISSVGKTNIKISWNKVSVTGYEVYRSTNNKKWSKVKTIKKSGTLSFNNTKLKTNKTYYYKVRAYKKINGKKVYGSFSDVVSAKTLTKTQINAINDANKYLKIFNCSKEELLSKLNYDSKVESFVINYLNINFKNNAYLNLVNYMKLFAFSKEELKKQLINYDMFTLEETEYALEKYNGEYGEDISSKESKYKKDLILLGYDIDYINRIIGEFKLDEIKKYLLNKKYNNLLEFKKSPYFVISNIDRYQNYYNKNKYTTEKVVLYVEIGIDYDFYTNMKKANVKDGKLILVNKYNYHDKNYNANLEKLGSGYGNGSLNKEAAEHFRKMVDDAKKDGIKLWSVSAYRSYSTQKIIYNRYVKNDGVKKADTYSARPGHSEHSTGLAVDINTASSSRHFENTKEYAWLKANSYKYGFIERYMKGKQFITGYKFEPWHFRYFGEEVATKLYEMNVTYEEYLIMTR